MDNKKEKTKNSLVIGDYPWSSDDEDDSSRPENVAIHPLNLMRRQTDNLAESSSQRSLDMPGPSREQLQSSSSPSDLPLRIAQTTLRKAQAKMERNMFWSLLDNHQTKFSISHSRLYDVQLPSSLSQVPGDNVSSSGGSGPSGHGSGSAGAASERHSGRSDRIAPSDIQRVLAFKRLTRNMNAINAIRNSNRITCPITRGMGAPSRNPLFNGGVSKRIHGHSSSRYGPSGSASADLQTTTGSTRTRPLSCGGASSSGGEPASDRRSRSRHDDNEEMPLNFCEREQTPANVSADVSDRLELQTPEDTSRTNGASNRQDVIKRIQESISFSSFNREGEMPSTSGMQTAAAVSGVADRSQELDKMDVDSSLDTSGGNENALEEEVAGEVRASNADSGQEGPAATEGTSSHQDAPLAEASNTGNDTAGPSQTPSRGIRRKREGLHDSEPLTVSEFNQRLLRLLECPVCMDWMEAPIAQCRRGHLICSRCRERLTFCPVCRTTFSSVRNRAMEGVADLLRYPCRHGCGREVRIRRRGRHEASCSARKYACPAAPCAARPDRAPLPHCELAHHFQSKHRDMLKIGRKHDFSMKVNLEHHDSWLIMALHEFFHLRVDVDVRSWGVIIYVAYIGPQCKAKNYTYEITVNGQYNSRKLVYARVTHSDLESSTLNVSRQDCFHLTLDQALNFLKFKTRHRDQDRYLEFNVEITKCGNTESGGEGSDGSD
ncbi:uncharacterized protein ACR2FA_003030 [Aphomia sociella]